MEERRKPDEDFIDLSRHTPRDGAESLQSPARLKSKVYSALIRRMEASGPLLSVGRTETTHGLCVFEKLVEIAPLAGPLQTFNACAICHARVLAERFDRPPIYWKNCPYVNFKNG